MFRKSGSFIKRHDYKFHFVIGQCAAKPLLLLIQTPDEILYSSCLYLRIYLCGYPFLMIYDFGSAILRAGGDSRYPFIALTISGISNVLLNLLFVVLFHMGVAGVALATVFSTMLSAHLFISACETAPLLFI